MKNRYRWTVAALGAMSALAVLVACGADRPSETPVAPTAISVPMEQAEPTPPGAPGDSQVVTTVVSASRYVVFTSFEELARKATAIVIGTGTGQRESRTIPGRRGLNDDEVDPNHTDIGVAYQVEVERYLKGAGPDVLLVYQNEGSLTIPTKGRRKGQQIATVDKAAKFPIREGVRYLFFLRRPPYPPDLMTGVAQPWRFVLDGGTASADGPWEGASEYFPPGPESDLIGTVEEIVLAASMVWARTGAASERVYRNLAETGADFAPDFGEARDATFTPTLTKDSAVEIAIGEFMRGFDLPAGRGIESRIDARAVTAIFSGSSDSFSRTWDVVEREVWVVALWDLPISIPCGFPFAGGCPDSIKAPHFTLAIDAHAGEIVGLEMAGAGGMSSTWDGVDLRPASVEPLVTPTPAPPATTVASSMDNPKRILPAVAPTAAATPPGPMATPEPTATPLPSPMNATVNWAASPDIPRVVIGRVARKLGDVVIPTRGGSGVDLFPYFSYWIIEIETYLVGVEQAAELTLVVNEGRANAEGFKTIGARFPISVPLGERVVAFLRNVPPSWPPVHGWLHAIPAVPGTNGLLPIRDGRVEVLRNGRSVKITVDELTADVLAIAAGTEKRLGPAAPISPPPPPPTPAPTMSPGPGRSSFGSVEAAILALPERARVELAPGMYAVYPDLWDEYPVELDSAGGTSITIYHLPTDSRAWYYVDREGWRKSYRTLEATVAIETVLRDDTLMADLLARVSE